jgi:hypothetical protein
LKQKKWKLDINCWCTVIYVFACAFRSFLPRIDAERMCFFHVRLSYPFIGRFVATIAEIRFAFQLSRFWYTRMRVTKQDYYPKVVRDSAFISCVMAQMWCWMGVFTRNQLYHAIEESHWCFASAILTISTIIMRGCFGKNTFDMKIGCVVGAIYTLFMIVVDVPMYLYKYQEIQKTVPVISFYDGLFDSFNCTIVSQRYEDWKDEMAWISGYFSIAVWISLYIASYKTIKPKQKQKLN